MAARFELTDDYLTIVRNKIKDDIAYARVLIEDSWSNVNVSSKRILADGRVEIKFIMNKSASNSITIANQMQLCMADGTIIGTYNVVVECKIGTLFTVRFNTLQV